jgi:hypothetical protein
MERTASAGSMDSRSVSKTEGSVDKWTRLTAEDAGFLPRGEDQSNLQEDFLSVLSGFKPNTLNLQG